jgi:hypothetical protein
MRFTKALWLLLGVTILAASSSSAQLPPQDGTFVKICSLHGEANQGSNAYHNDAVCNLPGDFQLDRTYHQQAISASGGGATSDISVADVPGGLHLDVSGNHYWSIVKPIKMVILDQDGPTVRQFQVHLYCGPAGFPGPGCSVHVDVYARRKQ